MARASLLVLALLLGGAARPVPVPATEVVVRVFALKYRAPEDAVAVVRPVLTEGGSVIVQPKGNVLTVRDSADAVERAARSIAAWDVPPRAIDLRITLLRAAVDPLPGPGIAPMASPEGDSEGIGDRLRQLFRFTSYSRLDTVLVKGSEGQTVASVLGGDYRIEFQIEGTDDLRQVRLKGLAFERIRQVAGPGIAGGRGDILRTTLNLPLGQPFILAVGRDEAAAGALVLVFRGTWRVPGPGIGGPN
jgi:hypothetical protein